MPVIQVTMKDPDTLYDAINEAVEDELSKSNLDDDEQESIAELRQEKYSEIAGDWFEYGEYVTLEIDTDKQSIRVVPVAELEKAR